jgi:hypothetical protein
MNREIHKPESETRDRRDGGSPTTVKEEIWESKSYAQGQERIFDPGASPLGTDDEAGGAPNTEAQVSTAMAQETAGMSATANAVVPPVTAANQAALDRGERQRFSPAVAIGLVGGIGLLTVVFAFLV